MTSVKKTQLFFFVGNQVILPTTGNIMAAGRKSYRERALDLTRDRGIARARDFKAAGIPLVCLKRLTESGDLIRLSRGLYQDPEQAGADVAHNLAEAARLIPNGVGSLLSALR